jgi:tetraacyldisaccharide 4'-kinase
MSFSFLFRSFRILLFPFAMLYGLGVKWRNWLYHKKIYKSVHFNLPLICVGNLSVGGTGKSPMVEYLIRQLSGRYKIATLSRGYRRKTSGYLLASNQTTALETGDEPLMFYRKFPGIAVAVGEERIEAIPQLLHDRPETEVIILDDAFQHRRVAAGFNILLTDYSNLYVRDFFLPTGDLRDEVKSAVRAQVIVVTKCPPGLGSEEKDDIAKQLKPAAGQRVFFATIEYGQPYHILTKQNVAITGETEVLLVTGIASPAPLKKYLDERVKAYDKLSYRDHHIFNIDDLKDIQKNFEKINSNQKIILTTEKDAMRLEKFGAQWQQLPLYVLPIETRILFNGETAFMKQVNDFVKEFNNKN